jgi:hypothetical protein
MKALVLAEAAELGTARGAPGIYRVSLWEIERLNKEYR